MGKIYTRWLAESEEKLKGRPLKGERPGQLRGFGNRNLQNRFFRAVPWKYATLFIVLVSFSTQESHSGDRMTSPAWVMDSLLGVRGGGWVIGRSFKTKEYVILKENWGNWDVDIKRDGKNVAQTSTVDILRQLIQVWLLAPYPMLRSEVDILRNF